MDATKKQVVEYLEKWGGGIESFYDMILKKLSFADSNNRCLMAFGESRNASWFASVLDIIDAGI